MLQPPFRFRALGLAAACLALLLDQASKALVLGAAQTQAMPLAVLPFFNLVLVWNRGISFGLFSHTPSQVALILASGMGLVVVSLLIWLFRAADLLTALALGCIIGGATGNLVDRLRFGAVTDFLDFHLGVYHFWAFNVADSAIFIGVVLLALISIVDGRNETFRETP